MVLGKTPSGFHTAALRGRTRPMRSWKTNPMSSTEWGSAASRRLTSNCCS